MKKTVLIRKALSYAKFLSEDQLMAIIKRITESEMTKNEGHTLDQVIDDELKRHGNKSGGFVMMVIDAKVKKLIYIHPDIPVGLKDYFIDTVLDNAINDNVGPDTYVDFKEMRKIEDIIFTQFLEFCQ